MKETITLLQVGQTPRLTRLLPQALPDVPMLPAPPVQETSLTHKRLLFVVGLDEFGPPPAFYELIRWLRQHPNSLDGAVAGVIVDGPGELYTKEAARMLVLAANLAGCFFPGKPLVEGTGSLYNQHIMAKNLGLTLEETYVRRMGDLAGSAPSPRARQKTPACWCSMRRTTGAPTRSGWGGKSWTVFRMPFRSRRSACKTGPFRTAGAAPIRPVCTSPSATPVFTAGSFPKRSSPPWRPAMGCCSSVPTTTMPSAPTSPRCSTA